MSGLLRSSCRPASAGHRLDELHRDHRRRTCLRGCRSAPAGAQSRAVRHRTGERRRRLHRGHALRRRSTQTLVQSGGARTQLAGLVVGCATLATLFLFAPAIPHLPQAVLAAIVIVYSLELVSLREFRAIAAVRRTEFIWALTAFAGVLLWSPSSRRSSRLHDRPSAPLSTTRPEARHRPAPSPIAGASGG